MFIAGYSFLAEGTTNATWGGSTQGTLDDLAEQDNDIQEQSAGYSRLVCVCVRGCAHALDCISDWFGWVCVTDTVCTLFSELWLGSTLEIWLLAVNFGGIVGCPEFFCASSESLQAEGPLCLYIERFWICGTIVHSSEKHAH